MLWQCAGSANYPEMTQRIIAVADRFQRQLIISSRKPECIPAASHVTVAAYLPLPQLLKTAALFIHHGGANTFSESLTLGVPQILIPLATDQPIQAELLRSSGAGIALYPDEVTEDSLVAAFEQLLNKQHPMHQRIQDVKEIFQQGAGARVAGDLIEECAA